MLERWGLPSDTKFQTISKMETRVEHGKVFWAEPNKTSSRVMGVERKSNGNAMNVMYQRIPASHPNSRVRWGGL